MEKEFREMLRRHSQQVPLSVLEKLIKEETEQEREEEEDEDHEQSYVKEKSQIQHLTG